MNPLPAALLMALMGFSPRVHGAEEAPWYIGLPVAQVSLEAVDGGLSGENLEPLLGLRQGLPYSPRAVRSDLSMLYLVGQFAAVEAQVEPWVGYDPEGNPVAAVRVVYLALPPPRIRRIKVEGAHVVSVREVLNESKIAVGDPFYPDQDGALVQGRLREFYDDLGFPRAQIELRSSRVDSRRQDVEIVIQEGQPQQIAALALVGIPEGLLPHARRVLGQAGIRVGERFAKDAPFRAREALDDMMDASDYPEAQVGEHPALFPVEGIPESYSLTYLVDPGRRLTVEIRGAGFFLRQPITEIMDLEARHAINDEVLAEAERRILGRLQDEGYLEATVSILSDETREGRRLRVRVDRGSRHHLKGIRFEGNSTWSDRYLSDAMKEADPTVLGSGRVTPDSVDKALSVVEEFYRSQGFLGVHLERVAIRDERNLLGLSVPTVVEVQVEEGPRTELTRLEISGDVQGIASAILEERRSEFEGKPYDPSRVALLAREMVEAYREEGYLQADATVEREVTIEEGRASALIVLCAGPAVILRNVIIQGNRRTRRQVIEREITLRTGEPVTPFRLSETREQLYSLELFRTVEPALIGDEDRFKDLLVTVDEVPNIGLDLGGALSTDEGVQAILRATHHNLWGRAHKLSFVSEAGLGYRGDEWTLDSSQVEWSAALRYDAPRVPGPRQHLLADLLVNETRQSPTFSLFRTGGGPGVQTDLGRTGDFVVDYRLEWRRLKDVDVGALVEGDPWLVPLGMPASPAEMGEGFDPADWGDPQLPSLGRPVSGPGFVLIVDKRDSVQSPRRGLRWTFQARADDGLLSHTSSVVAQSHMVQLFPVRQLGLLLGIQGGIGSALETGLELPIEDRFRLGGAGSLRGYEQDTVGPRNRMGFYNPGFPEQINDLVKYSHRTDPYRWVPTGGNAMLALTTELKVPFPALGLQDWPDAGLVGFVDVGNVYFVNSSARTTSSQEGGEAFFRVGYGAGFRYSTPIGPLQLDLGINPSPMTLRDEAGWRLHLSLGTL